MVENKNTTEGSNAASANDITARVEFGGFSIRNSNWVRILLGESGHKQHAVLVHPEETLVQKLADMREGQSIEAVLRCSAGNAVPRMNLIDIL